MITTYITFKYPNDGILFGIISKELWENFSEDEKLAYVGDSNCDLFEVESELPIEEFFKEASQKQNNIVSE
jgi:hypothetical protein